MRDGEVAICRGHCAGCGQQKEVGDDGGRVW